jgi:hypothetical protein
VLQGELPRQVRSGKPGQSAGTGVIWKEAGLAAFLRTAPADAGCAVVMTALHVHAGRSLTRQRGRDQPPGARAHLAACEPCRSDLAGLLTAIAGAATPPA